MVSCATRWVTLLSFCFVFYFEAQYVPDFVSGTQVGLCPFDMLHCSWSVSLSSGVTRGSRLIPCFLPSSPGINHLAKKKNWRGEWYLEVTIWARCPYGFVGSLLSDPLSVDRVRAYLHIYNSSLTRNIDTSITDPPPKGSFQLPFHTCNVLPPQWEIWLLFSLVQ